MADVINLRRARKEKAQRERNNEAQANRLRFGRTKAQKANDEAGAKRRQDAADQARLTPEKD